MRNAIAVLLLALALLVSPIAQAQTQTQTPTKPAIEHLYNSVALLYVQDEAGDMRMACTATAFDKRVDATPSIPSATEQTVYRFVSAAHCVNGKNDKQEQLQKFYISADTKGTKAYFPAKLIQTGDKTVGDDFSLFEVTTRDKFDVTPLGDSTKLEMGDGVYNVAGALGLGKQLFEGYVSEVHLDRPPVDAEVVQWTDLMLVQIGGGPGSSGSAIVSVQQNAIVGFLVGATQNDVGKMCVPVSKFEAFVKAVDAGTYKKSKKGNDNDDNTVAGAGDNNFTRYAMPQHGRSGYSGGHARGNGGRNRGRERSRGGDNGNLHGDHYRGHYNGHRFDHDYESQFFGREHVFVFVQAPIIVDDGFVFWYNDVQFGCDYSWPEGWEYSDGVYVDWDGGSYYLYNVRRNTRIAIIVR